jgi:hypothetical protein
MLADRFRGMSEGKLTGPLPPHATRAEAGRRMAQALADAALGVQAQGASEPPAWREVPELSPFAVGDQIAVTGQDLLAALTVADPARLAWTREGRHPTAQVVVAALDALRRLRLAL